MNNKVEKAERRQEHVCNVINPDANKASMSLVPKELDCFAKKQEIIWITSNIVDTVNTIIREL